MGEYAVDQMMRDFEAMTGCEADRSDCEREVKVKKNRICPRCGKTFRSHFAVLDHLRDKHKESPNG